MKPEHKKKIQEGIAAGIASRASQTIVINKRLKITRPDEYNWSIIETKKSGDEVGLGYYGRLMDALQALPHLMLDEGAKKSLRDIKDQMDEISKDLASLRFYKFGDLSDNTEGSISKSA